MKAIDIGLIQARRTKIDEEISHHQGVIFDHQEAIASLKAKLAELEIAERVFAELSLETEDIPTITAATGGGKTIVASVAASGSLAVEVNRAQKSETNRLGKPEGLPPITEMVVEALRHAHGLGAPGLKPAGITSYIRGRYWSGAPSANITPIVWRMWNKDKKLEKHGTLYALPEKDRPPTTVEADLTGESTPQFDILGRPLPRSRGETLLEEPAA